MENLSEHKPDWLKRTWRATEKLQKVEGLIQDLHLKTVCREASCPNYSECLGRGTATFMILGANCTRGCGFCGVSRMTPDPVDMEEPFRVATAISKLGLSYAVITSVTRDDLKDGGAGQFVETIRQIRILSPKTRIETLIPDFGGSEAALDTVIAATPDVISHNMETVRSLYAKVRPEADYDRSLALLRRVAVEGGRLVKCKSGVMAGVGETDAQMLDLMDDLRGVGCTLLTIGQYMRPSSKNIPIEAWIEPVVFDRWAEEAMARGFAFVASAPFVRSSYHAEEVFHDPA